ncbi:MAG: hypothetical protein QG657_5054 [Acidobacteriota bacterium]|nr:hypothetical protein [Acidobacteriota bacterium]
MMPAAMKISKRCRGLIHQTQKCEGLDKSSPYMINQTPKWEGLLKYLMSHPRHSCTKIRTNHTTICEIKLAKTLLM